MRIKQSDVLVSKQWNGSIECAVVVDGYRRAMVYYGYTKRQAVRLFVTDVNGELSNAKD